MCGVSTRDIEPSELPGRYGDPRRGRGIAILIAVVVAGSFLGWLAWATWFHATPEVTSELVAWEVVDAHTATAVIEVDIEGGAEELSCQVQAKSTDGTVVGLLAFEPVDGRNEVTIATEREATSVSSLGCTAEGQSRPR
jgi:hypothetical protein